MRRTIKDFEKFNESAKDSITLTADEKKYIWGKIEYTKKKKSTIDQDDTYTLLTSSGDSKLTEDELIGILNKLEYSIKKQMKDVEKKFKNEVADSIKSKIPDSWTDIKYSRVKKSEEEE